VWTEGFRAEGACGLLPQADDGAASRLQAECRRQNGHQRQTVVQNVLTCAVHGLGVGDELVELVQTVVLRTVLTVMGVLVVHPAVLGARLFDKTYSVLVMMVLHNGGQQHHASGYPNDEYVGASLHAAKLRFFLIMSKMHAQNVSMGQIVCHNIVT
jgi:hypothetical protein